MTAWREKWQTNSIDLTAIAVLQKRTGLSRVTAEILYRRGYTTVDSALRFLNTNTFSLEDPFLMPDMERAVNLLESAIKKERKICIYGDYDVDGITASVLLYKILRLYNIKADVFIPNRLMEGYGVTATGLKKLSLIHI